MTKKWVSIAVAEFKVQTSNQRGKRVPIMLGALVVGILWALLLAPQIMRIVLTEVFPIPPQIMMILMPPLLRAGLMLIWFILILFPLANALKEIKIGQWEVLLANTASSRDIFLGSFIGKLPVNGLIVLYLAPIIISPFAVMLEIELFAQVLIYGIIAITAIGAIWLADFIVTCIQARLGESDRGKDIANALAIILGIFTIIPFIGFQVFASQMLELLDLDIFLLFPFTWSADLITGISFQTIGSSVIHGPFPTIGLDSTINLILLTCYTLLMTGTTLLSLNRLYFNNLNPSGPRKVRKSTESLMGKHIRRLAPSAFSTVVYSVMKDFGRKAENLTRVGQMLGMSLFLPILVGFIVAEGSSEVDFIMILIMVSLAFAILSGQAFGATGFLESRNQLWILQSVPHGPSIYAKARVVQAVLFIIPCALISASILTFVMELDFLELISLFCVSFVTGFGSTLVAIGITASNPVYDDGNSAALKANTGKFMAIAIVSFLFYTILDFLLGMIFGLGDLTQAIYANLYIYSLVMFGPLPFVGILVFTYGTRKFRRLE